MKKKLFSALLTVVLTTAYAQNIVKNSDFNADEKKYGPEFRTNGGKLSVHTENATWNRCGKLAFDRLATKGKYRSLQAAVWIGGSYADNKKPGGFVCKPNTTYDFSIDIKSDLKCGGRLRATLWNDKQTLWHGKTVQSTITTVVKESKEWTTYKGSFKTKSDSVRAALCLSIGNDERYSPLVQKVGDYILFDNVVIKERKRPVLSNANAAEKVQVKIKKIIPADGTTYSDFHCYRKSGEVTAKTSFKVNLTDTAFEITFACQEPLKVTPAAGGNLWSGDAVEIFFAPKKADRDFSQFAVSADGRTYSSTVNDKPLAWTVKTSIADKGWSGKAVIPFESLGFDKVKKGDFIGFNFARQRKAAKELSSWAKVATGFSDLKNFGKIYCGSLPANTSREEFEKAQAQAEAAARQARIDSFRTKKFLCAPVSITEDFSVPFLPDSLFQEQKKIELRAAVNEIKPLPFAIYNNSKKTAVYQVTVEIPREKARDWHNGRLFPGVIYREAIAHRDNNTGESAILDPLPKMNEARTVTVPAGECALVWLDFNTYDLKPGEYKGRLRVIEVTGKAVFTRRGHGHGNYNYKGDMRDIPLTLKVDDIVLDKFPRRPCNYFSAYSSDTANELEKAVGMNLYQLSPWSLTFPLKAGKFTPSSPVAEGRLAKLKQRGYDKVFICYSSVYTFTQLYGKKNLHLFVDWVKTIDKFLEINGFDPSKSYIEIYDEPPVKQFGEVKKHLEDLHKANLRIKICMTLGAGIMSLENMKAIAPYVNHWILWRSGYFKGKGRLEFIKEQQAGGVTFGHYTCYTDIRAPLYKNFRHNAWVGEYYNMDYNDMYQSIKGLPGITWKGNGGDALLYNSEETVVPSIRYMSVRQGVTDVKYLDKLREVGKDSPEAQAFLKTAAKRVVVDKAHDSTEADKVREEAAKLILKLKK